jgi:hypothetical protein
MKRALTLILAISVFGTLFSGVLTYGELFGEQALSCPSPGAPGTVLGYPACVYGFFMYLAIGTVAALGLWAGRHTSESSRPRAARQRGSVSATANGSAGGAR